MNLEVELGEVSPRVYAEAVNWRVLAALRASMPRAATQDLNAARKAVAKIADPNFREGAENDLRLAESFLIGATSPDRAQQLLTDYLSIAEKRGRFSRLPEVLVARAGLFRRLGRGVEAETDLRRAIQLVEERRRSLDRDVFRDTFLGKSNGAYIALSELLESRGDVPGAIAAGDLPRARILSDRALSQASSLVDVSAALAPRTALITYGLFADRLVIFVIRRNGWQRFETHSPAGGFERSILRFAEALKGNRETQARSEGRTLHKVLIEPARGALAGSDHYVFVVDAPLHRVPFAALVQADGRFLVEDLVITIAPSIGSWAAHRPSSMARRAPVFAAIGNPSFDYARYPSLDPLDAAADEARETAAMYTRATVLVEDDATKARTMTVLRDADVLHFATHALADPQRPDRSRLLLAGGEALSVAEVSEMRLRVETVVLAGCRTAASGEGYGYVQNLAAAFLAAGARHVVGSLWDIEDKAGRQFSLALHRGLRAGLDPDQAMRRAQLELLATNDLGTWSAMQLYAASP